MSKLARVIGRGLHLVARCRRAGDPLPACLHPGDHGFSTLHLTLTSHTAEPRLGKPPSGGFGGPYVSPAPPGARAPSHTFLGPQEWCRAAHSDHPHCSHTPVLPSLHPGGHGPSTEALSQASSPPSSSTTQRKPTTTA